MGSRRLLLIAIVFLSVPLSVNASATFVYSRNPVISQLSNLWNSVIDTCADVLTPLFTTQVASVASVVNINTDSSEVQLVKASQGTPVVNTEAPSLLAPDPTPSFLKTLTRLVQRVTVLENKEVTSSPSNLSNYITKDDLSSALRSLKVTNIYYNSSGSTYSVPSPDLASNRLLASELATLNTTLSSQINAISLVQASTTSSQWSTSGSNISYAGGNIGVGTTTATHRLTVAGNAYFVGGTNTQIILSGDQGSTTWGMSHRSNGNLLLYSYNPASYFDYWGFANTFSFTQDGKMGIRTQSPASTLTIAGTPGNGFGGNANVSIGNAYAGTAAPANGLIVEGNVGIGTTTPAEKLTVAGNGYFGGNVSTTGTIGVRSSLEGPTNYTIFSQNSTYDRKIGFVWDTGGATAGINTDSGLSLYAGSGITLSPTGGSTYVASNLGVYAHGGTGSPASRLSVNGNAAIGTSYFQTSAPSNGLIVEGNVGIGTTTPTQKLSVAGNINTTGNFNFATTTEGSLLPLITVNGTRLASIFGPTNYFGDSTFFGMGAGGTSMSAAGNTGFGQNALGSVTIGINNAAVGRAALGSLTTGTRNTAIGDVAMAAVTSSSQNVAVGFQALYQTEGNANVAIGDSALQGNTSGSINTAVGYRTMTSNTTGSYNTAMSMDALLRSSTGSYNTAIGHEALMENLSSYNTALGVGAGRGVYGETSTSNNVFLGFRAGYANRTGGDNNILLGYQAGDNLTTGANNIVIGYDIDATSTTATGSLNIGNLIFGTGVDGTGTTLSSGNVGIGISAPFAKFSVNTATTGIGQDSFGGFSRAMLYSNGLFAQYPKSLMNLSANITDAASTVVGLNLQNASAVDNTYSPLITFSRTASQGLTNPVYAYIGGVATGDGPSIAWTKGDLTFATADTTTAGPIERMRIMSNGNMGVGTTTPGSQLTTTGTVQFANFGAGSLQTDANGNVTVSSDERLKDIQGNFTTALSAIEQLAPITYKWKSSTGYDTNNTYTGFSAQNVQLAIPEAVTIDKKGYLTLSDRPILATLVNAIKEIASFSGEFKNKIVAWMGDAGNGIMNIFANRVIAEQLCLGADEATQVCVTKEQLRILLLNAGQNIPIGGNVPTGGSLNMITSPSPDNTNINTSTTTVSVDSSSSPFVSEASVMSNELSSEEPIIVEPNEMPTPVLEVDPVQ